MKGVFTIVLTKVVKQNMKVDISNTLSPVHLDRVKRIWYLSPLRAAKVQASLRIRAASPEPPLLAHTSSESKGIFRQKARSLVPLNGWACAVEICHDGMLEDTNSLDGAHFMIRLCVSQVLPVPFLGTMKAMMKRPMLPKVTYEPRQANLCLRAFRHDKF